MKTFKEFLNEETTREGTWRVDYNKDGTIEITNMSVLKNAVHILAKQGGVLGANHQNSSVSGAKDWDARDFKTFITSNFSGKQKMSTELLDTLINKIF